MPIHYRIHPHRNLGFLICEGYGTAAEYFKAVQEVFKDKLYKHGMIRIADLLSASVEFDIDQMRSSIQFTEKLVESGVEQDHIILLTLDTGLHQLVKSVKLMSHKVLLKFDAYYSLEETITALGLSEFRQEITGFHRESQPIK